MTKLLSACMVCVLAGFLAVAGCTDAGTDQTLPAGAPDTIADGPVVWKDTCSLFASGNETAYNEILSEAVAGPAGNKTGVADLCGLSWSEAFFSLNALFKERYAFTEWRAVDFDALYGEYAPRIAQAEEMQDGAAYYRALREYLYAIPDGHVELIPLSGEYGTRDADIGGSYGIGILGLDDGTVIVSYVGAGSAAEEAGIRFGDEVLTWNGTEIHDAINETPYIWANMKPSTEEAVRLHQERLLTRAPVGTNTTVSLAGASGSRTVNLTAVDDGYDGLKKTSIFLGTEVNDYGVDQPWADVLPQVTNETITTRTLPGGYAYIAVFEESFGLYEPIQDIMHDVVARDAPGVVLDFRYNSGGDDNLAACFAGWFVEEPVFYEYTTTYDPGIAAFRVVTESWVSPRPDRYTGAPSPFS